MEKTKSISKDTQFKDLIPPKLKKVSYTELLTSNDIKLWERFYDYDFFISQIKGFKIDINNPYHRYIFPSTKYSIPLHFPESCAVTLLSQLGNIDIVDVGCGVGNFLCHLSELGYTRLKGVDCSYNILRVAEWNRLRRKGESKIKWIRGMARNIPLDNESEDFICSFNLIEHLAIPELFFKEAFRILRRGVWKDERHRTGFFIGSLPYDPKIDKDKDTGHIYRYTKQTLKDDLMKYFSKVRIYEIRNQFVMGPKMLFFVAIKC